MIENQEREMISFDNIAKSIMFYEGYGFRRIETPWLVTPAICDITRPEWSNSHLVTKEGKLQKKSFVASAEQGFLYLINKGHLPDTGQFQSTGPCMRDEPFDETHTKYFIKNELIIYRRRGTRSQRGDPKKTMVRDRMVEPAMTFMCNLDPRVGVVETGDDTYDIMLNGIEVGSYGYRSCSFCEWIYGTGIAEPRFSMASASREEYS